MPEPVGCGNQKVADDLILLADAASLHHSLVGTIVCPVRAGPAAADRSGEQSMPGLRPWFLLGSSLANCSSHRLGIRALASNPNSQLAICTPVRPVRCTARAPRDSETAAVGCLHSQRRRSPKRQRAAASTAAASDGASTSATSQDLHLYNSQSRREQLFTARPGAPEVLMYVVRLQGKVRSLSAVASGIAFRSANQSPLLKTCLSAAVWRHCIRLQPRRYGCCVCCGLAHMCP